MTCGEYRAALTYEFADHDRLAGVSFRRDLAQAADDFLGEMRAPAQQHHALFSLDILCQNLTVQQFIDGAGGQNECELTEQGC